MSTIEKQLIFLAKFHTVPVAMFTTDEHRYKQFECPKTALKVFLRDYAFEKSGAAIAYKYMSEKVIEKSNIDFKNISDEIIIELWNKFKIQECEYNNIKLNPKSNPLNCFKVIRSIKNDENKYSYELSNTRECERTILGILKRFKFDNIATWVCNKITNSEIEDAHKTLCKIRGVDIKVISLYMRDIAFIKEIDLNKSNDANKHLLQPIDTWLAQIYKIISNDNDDIIKEKDLKTKIQKWFNSECDRYFISPLEFNKGAWYFGSQISKTFKRLKKSLEDLSKSKEYINERLEMNINESSKLGDLKKII